MVSTCTKIIYIEVRQPKKILTGSLIAAETEIFSSIYDNKSSLVQRRVLLYKRRFPRTTSQVCDEYHLSK